MSQLADGHKICLLYKVFCWEVALCLVALMWAREQSKKAVQKKHGHPMDRRRVCGVVEGGDRIPEMAHAMPGTCLVCVADWDAHPMPLMQRAQDLDHLADRLVLDTQSLRGRSREAV